MTTRLAGLVLSGARVSLDEVLQHRAVTVEMDDAAHVVEVRGFRGAVWTVLERFENTELRFRRADGSALYRVDGHDLLIETKRGCGCRG